MAAAAILDIVSLNQSLKREWERKPPNLDKCSEHLEQLKLVLTTVAFMPTSGTPPSQQELIIARDVLETGALVSLAKKDIMSFERYMAQLKCYYMDYKEALPESAFMYQLLGLNLLCLLSQNRLAEFHMELELLPKRSLQDEIYIKHPVSMEQYLMEGSYNKVFLSRGNVPSREYNFFVDILLETTRDEISSCMEKAYDKIQFKEAARMLFFDAENSEQQMKEYAQKKNWSLQGDNYFHFKRADGDVEEVIPATQLAERAIHYARELEKIV